MNTVTNLPMVNPEIITGISDAYVRLLWASHRYAHQLKLWDHAHACMYLLPALISVHRVLPSCSR